MFSFDRVAEMKKLCEKCKTMASELIQQNSACNKMNREVFINTLPDDNVPLL